MSGGDPVVRFEADGDVAVITLDRPAVRNAVDPAMAEQLAAALDRLDADAGLRAGVLTGAGGAFCAGMDLREAARTGRRPTVAGRGFAGIVERPPDTPLVAAVEGPAVGGGCEVALACDLVVAAAGARFGLPEVRVGLVPGGGALFRLPSRIPHHVAVEMVLTGEPITGRRAHELGLANRLVGDGEAVAAAVALARAVAANAPVAVGAATAVLRRSGAWSDADGFANQAPYVALVRASADAAEGPRAFAERRTPRWAGR